MDAIVLVGGEGTRLRPLTYDTPKQMLPIVDRPLVEHVVSWLGRYGVERVVLSLGYRPDAFVEAYPANALDGVELAYAIEPMLLDTAGAIRFAAQAAGVSGRFVVVNGDVLTDFDLSSLVTFHASHGAEATIHLTPVPDPSAFGVVPTGEDGRVIAFLEKPARGSAPTNFVNAGTYVLEPPVLARIPGGRRVSIERETFPAMVADGALFALRSQAYWIDTGTPAKYLDAELDIVSGRRREALTPSCPEREPGVFVDGSARVEGSLRRSAYVGPGAVVESGAEVAETIVGAGARVCDGAELWRAVLLPGAVVGKGARLRGAIVGPGAVVGPGASLMGLTIVRGGAQVPAGAALDGERVGAP